MTGFSQKRLNTIGNNQNTDTFYGKIKNQNIDKQQVEVLLLQHINEREQYQMKFKRISECTFFKKALAKANTFIFLQIRDLKVVAILATKIVSGLKDLSKSNKSLLIFNFN